MRIDANERQIAGGEFVVSGRDTPTRSEFTSAFGGMADMAGLAAGSTWSRMTQLGHWLDQYLRPVDPISQAPPLPAVVGMAQTLGTVTTAEVSRSKSS
jgi:hypothetical protein